VTAERAKRRVSDERAAIATAKLRAVTRNETLVAEVASAQARAREAERIENVAVVAAATEEKKVQAAMRDETRVAKAAAAEHAAAMARQSIELQRVKKALSKSEADQASEWEALTNLSHTLMGQVSADERLLADARQEATAQTKRMRDDDKHEHELATALRMAQREAAVQNSTSVAQATLEERLRTGAAQQLTAARAELERQASNMSSLSRELTAEHARLQAAEQNNTEVGGRLTLSELHVQKQQAQLKEQRAAMAAQEAELRQLQQAQASVTSRLVLTKRRLERASQGRYLGDDSVDASEID